MLPIVSTPLKTELGTWEQIFLRRCRNENMHKETLDLSSVGFHSLGYLSFFTKKLPLLLGTVPGANCLELGVGHSFFDPECETIWAAKMLPAALGHGRRQSGGMKE